jgi:hypothetical protein
MAQVRDIKLFNSYNQDNQIVAEVNFSVEFAQAEVNQNVNFGLYVMLLAVDENMRPYQFENNGAFEMTPDARRQSDFWTNRSRYNDKVMWIAREVINPRGCKTQYFTRRTIFQRNSAFNQYPGFCANVCVIPEITEGRGWSNVCQFNPGQRNMNFNNEFDRAFDQSGTNYSTFQNGGFSRNGRQFEQVYSPGMIHND